MESQKTPLSPERILVIRRNRMGDMICTVPLLHALHRQFPGAQIDVACDEEGAAIAQACPAVNRVRVLARGWVGTAMNAMRLRGYDVVIAVKGGFDKRLALLARLTDAPIRIGFHPTGKQKSSYYTHPVPTPHGTEHQIETCLRLLEPLGVSSPQIDLTLRLPGELIVAAKASLEGPRRKEHRALVIVNISSNRALPLSEEQIVTLLRRLIAEAGALIGISCLPSGSEKARAHVFAKKVGGDSVFVLETPSVLELGAAIAEAQLVITPEGGVGHLAAALGTPALVLWGEGPFEKWRTWADNHRYLRLDKKKKSSTNVDTWQVIGEILGTK